MTALSKFAPHEMLELHGIINSLVTCHKKLQANLESVTDPDLKSFMEQSIELNHKTLNGYQNFFYSITDQKH